MSRVDQALRRASGHGSVESEREPDSGVTRIHEFATEELRPAAVAKAQPSRVAVPSARVNDVRSTPRLATTVQGKIVIDPQVPNACVEEYRRLATTLHLLQAQKGTKTLIVSSALPRDGKTLTSTNLALTLSESYKRRVLLLDADFRRPSVHEIFGLQNVQGLSDGLLGTNPLPVIRVTNQLTVLPAGAPTASPMAMLTSERMRQFMREARERFDWVILDTPPVGLISDASLLADLVDGVLLVIGAGGTPHAAIKRAISEFGRERILGVVLNRVVEDAAKKTYYGHYYNGDYYQSSPGEKKTV